MNIPPLNCSFEFRNEYINDFITAFHLSFYTQLAEIMSNPEPQIYKIRFGTLATSRCLLQINELNPKKNTTHPEHRTFSILFHV